MVTKHRQAAEAPKLSVLVDCQSEWDHHLQAIAQIVNKQQHLFIAGSLARNSACMRGGAPLRCKHSRKPDRLHT